MTVSNVLSLKATSVAHDINSYAVKAIIAYVFVVFIKRMIMSTLVYIQHVNKLATCINLKSVSGSCNAIIIVFILLCNNFKSAVSAIKLLNVFISTLYGHILNTGLYKITSKSRFAYVYNLATILADLNIEVTAANLVAKINADCFCLFMFLLLKGERINNDYFSTLGSI